jgi:hypothetical protein
MLSPKAIVGEQKEKCKESFQPSAISFQLNPAAALVLAES